VGDLPESRRRYVPVLLASLRPQPHAGRPAAIAVATDLEEGSMKLKLAPHHIAEMKQRAETTVIMQWSFDVLALVEHIEAIEEDIHEAREFIASLPPIPWRAYEEQ
jgi:hypothetical protein